MNEKELRIGKITALLNTAVRSKNSEDYNKYLMLLENEGSKPTLKEILDAQVAEKNRQKAEARVKEENEDRVRLDKARLMLESEERKHEAKRVAVKKQLQDSWQEDITLKELQKELETLKYQGLAENPEDPQGEVNPEEQEKNDEEEEKRIQEVIKRYEKMFGRIKGLDSKRSTAGSIAGRSIVSSKGPSKTSQRTEFSTISQKEAYEKLKKLDEEEEKIKQEKEELMKFLELRSQASRTSSRPTTVASLMQNKQETVKNTQEIIRKQDNKGKKELPRIDEEQDKEKKYKEKNRMGKNEIKERRDKDYELESLFKNL